jgi:hypothetical protein
MDKPLIIDNGVLIGVIRCPGANQLRDQCCLAGKTGSRKHDATTSPPDNTRMNEDAIRRMLSNVDHQITGKLVQDSPQVRAFRDDPTFYEQATAESLR